MLKQFKKINAKDIKDNPVQMLKDDWFLLTAGTVDNYNTMTAAWGGIGYLWNKPVVFCFIRPTRHTYIFFENNDYFSMCFFDDKYRDILNYCGKFSGRDVDKEKNTGLIALKGEQNSVIFQQSEMALECKKMYFDDIKPLNFIDNAIDKLYNNDYHRMYIGEILNVFKKV